MNAETTERPLTAFHLKCIALWGLFPQRRIHIMKQPIYNTALYLRLSRDDDNAGESNSIATQQEDGINKWVELIKQFSSPTELTAEMLNTLIEKILVHEATKDADGNRVQEIEIIYRFVGKID